ncbi:MAG: hypothetical protein H0V87_05765 [Chloroflexi bacterium]|nr:hypothetical protein [Chloroflexota bacterium]
MRSAVILGAIAVTTEYWEESQADGTRESGCRVQLRRVRTFPAPVPPPVPRRDAVFWAIEEPLWRADLFSEVGGGAPFDAAHYHPTFIGLTPCARVADAAIQQDPFAWISSRLADVPAMLAEAGHADLVRSLDQDGLRQVMPAILANVRATLAYRPG